MGGESEEATQRDQKKKRQCRTKESDIETTEERNTVEERKKGMRKREDRIDGDNSWERKRERKTIMKERKVKVAQIDGDNRKEAGVNSDTADWNEERVGN